MSEIKNENRKPRVLVFIYNPDKIGGPTTAMRLLINSWLRKHYEFKEIHIEGRIGMKIPIKLLNNLRKQIKSYDPDVIHVTGLQLQGFYATVASRLAGYKNILVVVRGSTTDMIRFSKIKKWVFGSILEPLTLRMSKVVYTVSQAMADKPLIKRNTNVFGGVVHNAIPNILLEKSREKSIRDELRFSQSDVLIVYTGRVTKEKGLQYALEAIRNMNNPSIKFIICGDGEDLSEFETAYKNEIENKQIFMLGRRDDVIEILKESDIFLFPTLHENLSNSLLEACAVGMPIIATSVGGNPEVIKDGVNGLLIPPHDTDAIRRAIHFLLENKGKREKFGKEANRIGNEKFSQQTIFESVDELYKLTMR